MAARLSRPGWLFVSQRGPSAALKRAIDRVRRGETAYAAAKAEQIALSTIYRSALYKALSSSRPARCE
jgi:hypothetical protein